MVKTSNNTFILADAVRLDAGNFAQAVKGLPARARMVLSAAQGLARGSLRIRVPDGRTFLVGGNAPGPDAEIILHNWNLPGRAFAGGTIGVAESYMDGDWD
ncbi:SAM-dependent methyltransferase, partial [Rhizobiaceae sp. 2RAB30]